MSPIRKKGGGCLTVPGLQEKNDARLRGDGKKKKRPTKKSLGGTGLTSRLPIRGTKEKSIALGVRIQQRRLPLTRNR